MQILQIINGLADPTDRPLYSPSSPGDGGSVKNTHDTATLCDKAGLQAGYMCITGTMHIGLYPVVGCSDAAPISASLNQ
jgi:hypothetical protein